MNEVWKDVPNYEGMYQVSNQGNVKSLDRYVLDTRGGKRFYKGIFLCLINVNGYKKVSLGRYNAILAHRLVAVAFIPNPHKKEFVNHINGIKSDNRVENLEWVTRQENETHAFATGLKNSSGGV